MDKEPSSNVSNARRLQRIARLDLSRRVKGHWHFGHRDMAQEVPSSVRLASHLALWLVAILVLALTQVRWPDLQAPARLPSLAPSPTPTAEFSFPMALGGPRCDVGGSLMRAAVPITKEPGQRREGIVHYTVVPGDTLYGIAKKFGISVDTVKWANDLELNPDMLRVGQDLVILPVSGVYHVVEKGDTLRKIAKRYKVDPQVIVDYKPNGLKSLDDPLPVDKILIIPGGTKPWVPPYVSAYSGPIPSASRRGTGHFVWPVTGHITALFGQLVSGKVHHGLDIGAWTGSPVVASDSGYVVYAGWNNQGYGNLVIINHGNGFVTYYAHLSKIFVRRGDSVAQGQRIGAVGATGHATGPHLHFEIRYHNVYRNPLGFLPH
ncbi:MAG: M23 family metallopeptidase [Anaerolineae bacterium]|nr:M23 family metallopeptidase [Anaerolineae bacterium]